MKSKTVGSLPLYYLRLIGNNLDILTALFICWSAFIYFVSKLTVLSLLIALFLAIFSLLVVKIFGLETRPITEHRDLVTRIKSFIKKPEQTSLAYLSGAFILFWLAAVFELIAARSDRPLISPWEVVSGSFFFFYILASLALILLVCKNQLAGRRKIFLISAHYFLSLSVAALVYKIGYGFDPFIHQAAMEIIVENGAVYPKTPYYLGQYGIMTAINKLIGIPLEVINRFLVPAFAAWLLPTAVYRLTQRFNQQKIDASTVSENSANWLAVIFSLALSLPLFIVTTPQNLSYVFIILAIFSGLSDERPLRTTIFSLAACAIHPIAGLPALAWSAWLIINHQIENLSAKHYRRAKLIIFLSGSLLLPISLFIASGGRMKNIHFSLQAIKDILSSTFTSGGAGREDWLMNLVYFLEKNQAIFILVLIGIGFIALQRLSRRHKIPNLGAWQGLITINLALIIAFILSTQVSFTRLIAYEQADYAKRIITIITIFAAPFALVGLQDITKKISGHPEKPVRAIWLFLGLIFLSSSLYLSYPRFDKYFNSRGYSTSALDIEAVKTIDKQATKEYIVLANQQVAAAALKTYGFDNYHQTEIGPIYFYPIPTGGALYQYYLDMVYKNPSKNTMREAMDLAGVKESYFIINKYWQDSGRIIQAAKLSANSWQELGNKDVFIFHYKR